MNNTTTAPRGDLDLGLAFLEAPLTVDVNGRPMRVSALLDGAAVPVGGDALVVDAAAILALARFGALVVANRWLGPGSTMGFAIRNGDAVAHNGWAVQSGVQVVDEGGRVPAPGIRKAVVALLGGEA